VIVYLYLWFAASFVAVVAGCIAAHSNHKLATAPYVMDLETAEHRRWQTMHPAHHRAPGIGSNEFYVPRHRACGDTTLEFDRIVASLNWVEAAA
jgi:hypothetical protein